MSEAFQKAAEGYEEKYAQEKKAALIKQASDVFDHANSVSNAAKEDRGLEESPSRKLVSWNNYRASTSWLPFTEVPIEGRAVNIEARLSDIPDMGNVADEVRSSGRLKIRFTDEDGISHTSDLMHWNGNTGGLNEVPSHLSDDYKEVTNILTRMEDHITSLELADRDTLEAISQVSAD